MSQKCESCGEKIESNDIGKLNGTIVKRLKGERNELVYFCSDCQSKEKDKKTK